ncbi:hypothetical protein F4778DRAFT_780956 [Xylariomycetidae sp. FL2044]|nr:hypothetical protein F4778DRAFT_780956 [Xylariomycetidae sp. FL2044]
MCQRLKYIYACGCEDKDVTPPHGIIKCGTMERKTEQKRKHHYCTGSRLARPQRNAQPVAYGRKCDPCLDKEVQRVPYDNLWAYITATPQYQENPQQFAGIAARREQMFQNTRVNHWNRTHQGLIQEAESLVAGLGSSVAVASGAQGYQASAAQQMAGDILDDDEIIEEDPDWGYNSVRAEEQARNHTHWQQNSQGGFGWDRRGSRR